MNYRKDIDGLRAIAVVAVVFYHILPDVFSRGFIGVDIFFVISGYLITKRILNNHYEKKFSYLSFYKSRFLRIFPSLVLVLAFCTIISLFIFYDIELVNFGNHLLSSLFFFSNYVYMAESGYFDVDAAYKPLLHLWSLSIEFQYYLFAPFFIIFCLKKRCLSENLILTTILFYFMLYAHDNNSNKFFSFFRIWEILIGALAFNYEKSKLCNFFHLKNKYINISIFVLLVLTLLINTKTKNPQLYSLIPVLCTFIIIVGGEKNFINKNILSKSVFVYIGLISYPLYLWHWPLISFLEISSVKNIPIILKISVLIISFIFAIITYEFIEKKVRIKQFFIVKTSIIFIIPVFILFFVFVIKTNNGFPERYPKDFKISNGNINNKVLKKISKCPSVVDVEASWCRTTKNPVIALIGDSHADLLMPALVETKHPILSKVISLGAGNCSPAFDTDLKFSRPRCTKQALSNIDYITKNKNIKYVIITSWGHLINNENKILENKQLFEQLLKLNKKIIFVEDMPTLKKSPQLCQRESLFFRKLFKKEYSFCKGAIIPSDFSEHYFSNGNYKKLINYIENSYPEINLIYTKKLFCTSKKCKIIDGNNFIYSDEGHISKYASKIVVKELLKKHSEHVY